jgi:hypothetical protein
LAVLVAGAASTAAAQYLRIESFERDGAITFNEVASAPAGRARGGPEFRFGVLR